MTQCVFFIRAWSCICFSVFRLLHFAWFLVFGNLFQLLLPMMELWISVRLPSIPSCSSTSGYLVFCLISVILYRNVVSSTDGLPRLIFFFHLMFGNLMSPAFPLATIDENIWILFRNVASFSDGLPDEGKGIPYFYLTTLDPTARNALEDQRSSFTLSEYNLGTCGKSDPEDPSCSKITIGGKVIASRLITFMPSAHFFLEFVFLLLQICINIFAKHEFENSRKH